MSYARKQLARGEEVVYDGGQHWFAVVIRVWWAIVLAVLSLAVLLWALSWDDSLAQAASSRSSPSSGGWSPS